MPSPLVTGTEESAFVEVSFEALRSPWARARQGDISVGSYEVDCAARQSARLSPRAPGEGVQRYPTVGGHLRERFRLFPVHVYLPRERSERQEVVGSIFIGDPRQ